ncbi:MAG: VCBS repeat-containing protein, partial [Myxococcales bacterium]|nr:VCBS repeat-containing protein [Myxococcales bacterium]
DGGVCGGDVVDVGRCLALPPSCDPQAGVTEECINTACEFKPEAENLNATMQWWWGPDEVGLASQPAKISPEKIDVWSTPTVGRIFDANCDGEINELDPPSLVFMSGDVTQGTGNNGTYCSDTEARSCRRSVLRVVSGVTGEEIWSQAKAEPTSMGFVGTSPALGDIDGDGKLDIVAMTGEGYMVVFAGDGTVLMKSDQPFAVPNDSFGWGGGIFIGDMDRDGFPEVGYNTDVWTSKGGALTYLWKGGGATAGGSNKEALAFFADVTGDADLELVTGRAIYDVAGTRLWRRDGNHPEGALTDGFPGVADFDKNGKPEVVLVTNRQVYLLDGDNGNTVAGPVTLGDSGDGGPPTVADFDGDGFPEIGVAQKDNYFMLKPDLAMGTIAIVWTAPNHDQSSSKTGSTVFDFEGDGTAEVVYNDECFLWVYDGKTGAVRLAIPTKSFTGTESSIVADVDGDGRAEIVVLANGVNNASWNCTDDGYDQPDPVNNRPAWTFAPYGTEQAWRGLRVFRDSANGWVGTRTLWNQHAYSVTNICDPTDSSCDALATYGSIPKTPKKNWSEPWLNNFRQNVQDQGIFDAPDATLSLRTSCASPPELTVAVRNGGTAILPSGVQVGIYRKDPAGDQLVGSVITSDSIFPGSAREIVKQAFSGNPEDDYYAVIINDPQNPTFRECDDGNNRADAPPSGCPQIK